MTESLLKTGKHTITALTRIDSTSTLPSGVIVKKIDYDNHHSIVEALRGQDALIITLGVMAQDLQPKLVHAAAEANVPWIFPNEWGCDTDNEGLLKDLPTFKKAVHARDLIKELGKSSYIAVSTGFWYEWSIAMPAGYGFDFANRAVTLYDDGKTPQGMSTWLQVGRAVVSLLSLPIRPEGEDQARCLERFRNQRVYVSSFTVSQKDMLDSVLRVTKTSIEDWKVSYEPSKERYSKGLEEMQKGDMVGFAKMLYARAFYPDDSGNYEKTKGTINELLGLKRDNIDEATEAGIRRAKEMGWPL